MFGKQCFWPKSLDPFVTDITIYYAWLAFGGCWEHQSLAAAFQGVTIGYSLCTALADYSYCSTDTGLAKNNHGPHKGVWLVVYEWGDVCMLSQSTDWVPLQCGTWYFLSCLRCGPGAGVMVQHLQSWEKPSSLTVPETAFTCSSQFIGMHFY